MERSKTSMRLYETMKERGYPEQFCDLISQELHTDLTANRMLGYLSHYSQPPMGEIVDEMLSILEERDTWVQKKMSEKAQASWNQFLMEGIEEEE